MLPVASPVRPLSTPLSHSSPNCGSTWPSPHQLRWHDHEQVSPGNCPSSRGAVDAVAQVALLVPPRTRRRPHPAPHGMAPRTRMYGVPENVTAVPGSMDVVGVELLAGDRDAGGVHRERRVREGVVRVRGEHRARRAPARAAERAVRDASRDADRCSSRTCAPESAQAGTPCTWKVPNGSSSVDRPCSAGRPGRRSPARCTCRSGSARS